MSITMIVAIIIAIILAMNIGANNSGTNMGTAYGASVRTRKEAIILIAIFTPIGAFTVGRGVIKTIGQGLIMENTFKDNLGMVLIVIGVTASIMFVANMSKVPIASAHAIVCSVAALGLYERTLNTDKFLVIVLWWLITPVLALGLSFLAGKFAYQRILGWLSMCKSERKLKRIIGTIVTISGCYLAFAAGSNNAAKSVAPIVTAGIINPLQGVLIGGLAMAGGALLLGSRVLEMVGKGITELCVVSAIIVKFVSATIILIASIFGMPVSISEIVTIGIIGLGFAKCGIDDTAKGNIKKICWFWVLNPILALGIAYGLIYVYNLYIKY